MESLCRQHDLPDQVWARLEKHLPGRKGSWGGQARDNRQFVNAVFWILRTGAPWRDLPPGYGDWKNTHRRFCRWRDSGIWEGLLELLLDDPDFEWLLADAAPTMARRQAPKCAGGNQDTGEKRSAPSPRYIWPWLRMVCRSERLLQQVPRRIVRRLS